MTCQCECKCKPSPAAGDTQVAYEKRRRARYDKKAGLLVETYVRALYERVGDRITVKQYDHAEKALRRDADRLASEYHDVVDRGLDDGQG